MKCLFLAAGYATRLYPLTEIFPKPLLEVAGRSILDRLIDDLDATGRIDGYAVVTNHKFAGHFTAWAEQYGAGCRWWTTAHRPTRRAWGPCGTSVSLSAFLDYARKKGTSCIMRYQEPSVRRLRKSGVVQIARDGRVLSMEEKPLQPKAHWCCPPFYFYKKEDLARLDEALAAGCGVDAPGSLAAWIASVAPVYAMKMPGPRYDIGNLESYRAVCEVFEAK